MPIPVPWNGEVQQPPHSWNRIKSPRIILLPDVCVRLFFLSLFFTSVELHTFHDLMEKNIRQIASSIHEKVASLVTLIQSNASMCWDQRSEVWIYLWRMGVRLSTDISVRFRSFAKIENEVFLIMFTYRNQLIA
jgi:hypothetical protein